MLEVVQAAGAYVLGLLSKGAYDAWRDRTARKLRKVDFERQLYNDLSQALPKFVRAGATHKRPPGGESRAATREIFNQARADWDRLYNNIEDEELRASCEAFSLLVMAHAYNIVSLDLMPDHPDFERLRRTEDQRMAGQIQDDREQLAKEFGTIIRSHF